MISFVAFVLSLSVPHFSFLWCLGKAIFLDSGISWESSLISFIYVSNLHIQTDTKMKNVFSFSAIIYTNYIYSLI